MSRNFEPRYLSYDPEIGMCFLRYLNCHTESEYSDVSAPPLLNYPCGISMVCRGTGVETRIAVGPLGKVTCVQGKFSALAIHLSIDLHTTVIFVILPCLRGSVIIFRQQSKYEGSSGVVGYERRHKHHP